MNQLSANGLAYFALDIETTGLNPLTDQVIQVAVVYDDFSYVDQTLQPRICFDVYHERYSGDPFALAMNAAILKRIADVKNKPWPGFCGANRGSMKDTIVHHSNVSFIINTFTRQCLKAEPKGGCKPIFAGKNIGSFDLQFLPGVLRHHRTIDVGSLWLRQSDVVPPSLDECLVRAGFDNTVTHDALSDCFDIVKCVRARFINRGQ